VFEPGRRPGGHLTLGIARYHGKGAAFRLRAHALCDFVEERRLRPEDAEERDFVDAGFLGDEARRRAAEPVEGIDEGCRFDDAFAVDHGAGMISQPPAVCK